MTAMTARPKCEGCEKGLPTYIVRRLNETYHVDPKAAKPLTPCTAVKP
jgi:hypothetical protein